MNFLSHQTFLSILIILLYIYRNAKVGLISNRTSYLARAPLLVSSIDRDRCIIRKCRRRLLCWNSRTIRRRLGATREFRRRSTYVARDARCWRFLPFLMTYAWNCSSVYRRVSSKIRIAMGCVDEFKLKFWIEASLHQFQFIKDVWSLSINKVSRN